MRNFEKRDEEKVKTDKAKNDFESVIYSMRDWLNDDENNPYIVSDEQRALLTKLSEHEEWLLEGEGDTASHTEYEKRFKELNKQLTTYKTRKSEHSERDSAVGGFKARLDKVEEKLDELAKKKPWITTEQKGDVKDKLTETRNYLADQLEKQVQSPLNADPVFKLADIEIKVKKVETVLTKVSSTAKPKGASSGFNGKNIKIDNMTFNGDSDVNWNDFIKINNGGEDVEVEDIPVKN